MYVQVLHLLVGSLCHNAEVQHLQIFTTHECVHLHIAGMLLTDLKARMVESADEVRGISDILLQRVSGGEPAGCEVKLVGVRWTYVHMYIRTECNNIHTQQLRNCIVSMIHSVCSAYGVYVRGSKVFLVGVIDFTSIVTHSVFFVFSFTLCNINIYNT